MSDKTKPRRTATRHAHVVFRRASDTPEAFADVVVFGDAMKALEALGGELRGYEYAKAGYGEPLTSVLRDKP